MALKMNKKKPIKKPKIVKRPIKSETASIAQKNSKATEVQLPSGEYIEAVGRRKVSTARVRIYPKTKGNFYVNDQLATDYFAGVKNANTLITKPLSVIDMNGQFAISAKVSGSGINGQLDAVVHGLAKAIIEFNPELRSILKQAGLLTRDDRMKETRTIGRGGKARRKRQSPKR